MNNLLRTTVYSLLTLLVAGQAIAQELSIYPAKDQSAEQMEKDKYECYNWAKKDSGFDPHGRAQGHYADSNGREEKGRCCERCCSGRSCR